MPEPPKEIPDEITIEPKKENIRNTLCSIIDSMSRIRFEAINNKNLDEARAREYALMTYKLASILDQSAAPATKRNLQTAATLMAQDTSLLFYDPMQDAYWKQRKPEFVDALDRAIIQIMGERCTSLDYKHHVAQAVKYLGARSLKGNERKLVMSSISPVHGHVRGDARHLFTQQYIDQFSTMSENDFSGQFTLRIGNTADLIANAVNAAKQLGYLSIQVGIKKEEYLEIEKRFPGTFPKEVDGKKLRDIFGKRDDRVIVEIPLNKAPSKPELVDYFANLCGLLENQKLGSYVKSLGPEGLSSVLYGVGIAQLQEAIFKALAHIGINADPSKVEVKSGTSLLDKLAEKAITVVEHFLRYPDIFGYSKNEPVAMNSQIRNETDVEEYLWEGSTGKIAEKDKTLSIRFSEVIGKKRRKWRKKGKTKTQKRKDLEGKVYDISPEHLERVEETQSNFPDWYKRGEFELGDVVKVKPSLADEDKLGDNDVFPGSIGKIIGYTYRVKFDKLVAKDGTVSEPKKPREETEINQVYLDRQLKYDKTFVEDVVISLVQEGLKKLAKDNGKKINFDFIKQGEASAYVNAQQFGAYTSQTLLIYNNGESYAVSCISPSERALDPKEIVAGMTDRKQLAKDSFQQTMQRAGAIYAHFAEYREHKKVEDIELVGN